MAGQGDLNALSRLTLPGRAVAAALALAALAALVLLAALAPGAAIAACAAVATLACGWVARDAVGPLAAVAVALLLSAAGAAVVAALVVGAAIAVAAWPVTVGLATIVAAILVLAWRAPALALAGGVLLIGFEGSAKILLGLEPTPLPFTERAVGAAAIDLALFGAVAGVLLVDRLRAPRGLWRGASRAERVAIAVIGAWLVLSIAQIAQGGDPGRGVEGFRLLHAYVAVGAAAAVVAARPGAARVVLPAVCAVGLAVALYATVRVAISPAAAEERFATSILTTTNYGHALRAVGSFSSAVGLASYLTPLAVFGLVAGLLAPRVRLLAWAVAALATVGVVGSYGRAPLVAIAAGLVFAVVVLGLARDVPARRKLLAAGLVVAGLAVTYGGMYVASRAEPALRERAAGLLDPLGDASVRERLDRWNETLSDVRAEPLGRGIGAAGGASADDRRFLVTTDNSFLKVLLDQGIPGGVLFAGGLLAAIALLARRLSRAAGEARAAGLAALAGFVAFLALAATGEYLEQPGKALAWALLGIAAGIGLTTNRDAAA